MKLVRVQHQPLRVPTAVQPVAGDRRADVSELHAELMRTTRFAAELYERARPFASR